MVPLALAGLAVSVAFRAGILNIGAEGQLLVGAAAATAISGAVVGVPWFIGIPVMLVVGATAGGAWAAIAGALRLRFGVLEVISTIMLNFVAQYLTGWLVRGPLQEPTRVNPQSASLAPGLQMPVLLDGTRLHAGVVVAVVNSRDPDSRWQLLSSFLGFLHRHFDASIMTVTVTFGGAEKSE
jgi:simple sugar transport system permease protein